MKLHPNAPNLIICLAAGGYHKAISAREPAYLCQGCSLSKYFLMRPVAISKLARLLTLSLFGLGTLFISSCSRDTVYGNGVLMRSDFDHLNGWIGDTSSFTRDKAHSGAHSLVVKPGAARSLGYDAVLGQLCSSRPDKIYVSAWIMRTGNQNATKLVVEIKDPDAGDQVFREDIDLGKEVQKLSTWQRFEHGVVVPPKVSANAHIMVYLSGAETNQPTYLDDLVLSLNAN
jgi:hypothetical protein